jgi:transposase
VIRTSVPKKQMTSADAVRSYKVLAEVERAFRSMKTIDLHIRPIHHRLEERVRAHIREIPFTRTKNSRLIV